MSDPREKFFKPIAAADGKVLGYPTYQFNQTCNATPWSTGAWIDCVYTVAAMLFICSLKGLSNQESATWGCVYGCCGMLIAVLATFFSAYVCDDGIWLTWASAAPGVLIGAFMGYKVEMIQMPQMVGLLNAFGGLASAVEAIGLFMDKNADNKAYLEFEGTIPVLDGKVTAKYTQKMETGDWDQVGGRVDPRPVEGGRSWIFPSDVAAIRRSCSAFCRRRARVNF